MKRWLWFAIGFAFGLSRSWAAADLPLASEVVQRVLERAQLVAAAGPTNYYRYEKRAVVSELDDKGRALKSIEKVYDVILIGGLPFPRLVKVQGRALSAKQLERENQREMAFRQAATQVDLEMKAKRQEGLATKDLVDRFDFQIANREIVAGRPTLVVTFVPRPHALANTIQDKILGKVSGTLWVDEHEAEVTKLDASVRGPIPLGWFGAVGSLQQFQASVERTRLADGIWVNRRSHFLIVARKLFSTVRSKTMEESSGFRRE